MKHTEKRVVTSDAYGDYTVTRMGVISLSQSQGASLDEWMDWLDNFHPRKAFPSFSIFNHKPGSQGMKSSDFDVWVPLIEDNPGKKGQLPIAVSRKKAKEWQASSQKFLFDQVDGMVPVNRQSQGVNPRDMSP